MPATKQVRFEEAVSVIMLPLAHKVAAQGNRKRIWKAAPETDVLWDGLVLREEEISEQELAAERSGLTSPRRNLFARKMPDVCLDAQSTSKEQDMHVIRSDTANAHALVVPDEEKEEESREDDEEEGKSSGSDPEEDSMTTRSSPSGSLDSRYSGLKFDLLNSPRQSRMSLSQRMFRTISPKKRTPEEESSMVVLGVLPLNDTELFELFKRKGLGERVLEYVADSFPGADWRVDGQFV